MSREDNGDESTDGARRDGSEPRPEERLASALASGTEILARSLARRLPQPSASPNDTEDTYGLDASEDTASYRTWLDEQRKRRLGASASPAGPPSGAQVAIELRISLSDGDTSALERSVGSMLAQSHGSWTLRVFDPSGHLAHEAGRSRPPSLFSDARIAVVRNVMGTSPRVAPRRAPAPSIELVMCMEAGDLLEPDALEQIALAAASNPRADVFYADEDTLDVDGRPCGPRFKPQWSPELLLCFPYLGSALAVRRELFDSAFPADARGMPASDYDLMLRVGEAAREVVGIPHVLYHRSADHTIDDACLESDVAAIESALERRGEQATVEPARYARSYRIRREVVGDPLVSVIVPFRDEPALLRACIDSLGLASAVSRFEVVLVDNDSVAPETEAVVQRLISAGAARVVRRPGRFNWSAINNAAARSCRGELLLFLNNDIEARNGTWMRAMVEEAQRPEIGAVGARLLYPDGSLQHAGVVLGLHILAAHVMNGLPAGRSGYCGWAQLVRNCSAVTAAAMMCRRDLFEQLGGFDEALPVAFNDVDFCLRLQQAGYRVVYTPFSELVHHESRTRGSSGYYRDYQLFIRRWTGALERGDPYFSENLSRLDSRCVLRPPDEDARWHELLAGLVADEGAPSAESRAAVAEEGA